MRPDLNPLWNQKAAVVGDQMQLSAFALFVPANELVPGFDFPGRTGPSQTRHHLIPNHSQITQVLSDQFGDAQVVVMVEQILPQVALFGPHQAQGRFGVFGHRADQRPLVEDGD